MPTRKPIKSKYKRILLKLSGEAFRNPDTGLSIDPAVTADIARQVKAVQATRTQVAIVVGGGNIFRGQSGELRGIDRNTGDYMGMLATVINALALQDALEKIGVDTRVQTAIEMREVAEPFIRRRAVRHLAKHRVVIFAAGTGNPYFTTDSAAALRAAEIDADALLKATNVDGVYSSDPNKNPKARRYKKLTYSNALARQLRVMDASAFSLCMDNDIPIIVFNFFRRNALASVVSGKQIGTLVCRRS